MPVALISVSDKRNLIELTRGLHEMGWDLLASAGTATAIRQAGIPVEDVSTYTGSPEILTGRVKTLHPMVHAGLLARDTLNDRADLELIGARFIDLLAVNLYPFRDVIARDNVRLMDAIENIDIGGVALIRAGAKNFSRVTVLTDPGDYPSILSALRERGEISYETRHSLACKAFAHTASYDAAIEAYFNDGQAGSGQNFPLTLYPVRRLRYGENPHQQAVLYGYSPDSAPMGGKLLQGKELSYNNLLDLDSAWRSAQAYERPALVIVKHLSPCGIACADSIAEAFSLALASDPISAFGGVIASNRSMDGEFVAALGDLFVECIAAPSFSKGALNLLSKRKNLRLLEMSGATLEPHYELRSVNQGVLYQTLDLGDPPGTEWQVVTQREPTAIEWRSLRFAWVACQYVKSNAIVFAQGEATIGIGGGQPNRVDCVRIAAQRAGERANGAVMASDAFFPFPDAVEEASKAGITAIISPGGSKRDEESIAAADQAGMAMIFTGVRHFRH